MVVLFQTSLDLSESYRSSVESAETCLIATREHFFSSSKTITIVLGEALHAIEAGKSVVGTNEPPRNGGYGVLKVSAVGENGFRPTESKALLSQDDFLSEYSVKAGDLVLTRANTPDLVGMSCVVETDYPHLMLCDKTLRLVPKTEFSTRFLLEALWTLSVRQQLRSVATGTGAAMKNISQEKIRNIQISVPATPTEQLAITEQIGGLRNAVDLSRKRVRDTLHVHQALLTHVLSGIAQ